MATSEQLPGEGRQGLDVAQLVDGHHQHVLSAPAPLFAAVKESIRARSAASGAAGGAGRAARSVRIALRRRRIVLVRLSRLDPLVQQQRED